MKQQRLSVLYFSNALTRAGAEQHMLTLLAGLDRKCFRPLLVCHAALAESLRPDLPADVELWPLCLRKPSHLTAAMRLAKILRDQQVDILHSHLFYSSLFASPVGWACRVPVILETPHVAEKWRRGWFKSRYVVDRLVGRFVDYYIAVSRANHKYLVVEKSLPAGKIVVIQNGCDIEKFDPDRPAPAGLKRSMGFDDSDPVLIVLGRLEPQKGHRVLLEALPAVRDAFPRVRVVCVGEGRLRTELEMQTRALGLEASVRFVGYQSNVPDWLALSDVSVLPSFYEGLPLAALESLSAGRPVVATAVDGTPEVVIDGKTGFTVAPSDSTALAAAICRLLGNPDWRREMGRAGREHVTALYSERQQIQKTQDFYFFAWEQSRRAANCHRAVESAFAEPSRIGKSLV